VLTFDFDCPPLVPGGDPISGTDAGLIDEVNGSFSVSGAGPGPVYWSFSGTVASDGNSMSGNWSFSHHVELGGTFIGVRNTAFTPEVTSTPTATSISTSVPTLPSLGGVAAARTQHDAGGSIGWLGLGLAGALVLSSAAWCVARFRS
jgi:hypothetical protein